MNLTAVMTVAACRIVPLITICPHCLKQRWVYDIRLTPHNGPACESCYSMTMIAESA